MARKAAGRALDIDSVIESIEIKRKELENSAWLAAFSRELKKFTVKTPREIRFLAVGNFGLENNNSEFQTALVLILCERFRISKVTAWDPNFKKLDLHVLSNLGISVKEADSKEVCPDTDLLWFAPHAPYYLEPSLLKRVRKSVYIGNDLQFTMKDSMREDKECAWYKDQAQIVQIKVKPKDPWYEAFKNTAIHQLKESEE